MLKKEIYIISIISIIASIVFTIAILTTYNLLSDLILLLIPIILFPLSVTAIVLIFLDERKIYNLVGKNIKNIKITENNRIFLIIKVDPRDNTGIWCVHILHDKTIYKIHFYDYKQFLKDFIVI